MNLIINTVGGQFLTLTTEMLQEKLGLKSDILSLGIEVSDDNTAITAQSYTKWECAGDTICPLIDVNVKNDGKEMQASPSSSSRTRFPVSLQLGRRTPNPSCS